MTSKELYQSLAVPGAAKWEDLPSRTRGFWTRSQRGEAKVREIFEPGTRVTVLANGRRLRGEVVRYFAGPDEYVIRLKSGYVWTAWAMWVQKSRAR
jgi:hypothetical protein